MSFESVYCVTTRLRLTPGEAIDNLACTLHAELPVGYRDYLMTLGKGELCDWLRVHTPEHVRADSPEELPFWRGVWAQNLEDGRYKPGPLTAADLAEAVAFASSAEGDQFVCCPRHGPALFQLPRHADAIEVVEGGFYGVAELGRRLMEHDFPYFDAWDPEHRWHRDFIVPPDLGAAGLIAAVKARWEGGGFRQSRKAHEQPSLFVRAVGARMAVSVGTRPGTPAGSCEVAMVYDKEADAEVSAFVGVVAVPESDSGAGPSPWQD